MTMTSGNLLVTRPRQLRANWPALLLPVVAAAGTGLISPLYPADWMVTARLAAFGLCAAAVIFTPALAAKLTPFALFGYGCAGFPVAHFLLVWRPDPVLYGVLNVRSGQTALTAVLPQALLFIAASVWLLVLTGGPGSQAVCRAVRQWRGVSGQRGVVPALLLLPVVGLGQEVFANPLWFGGLWGKLAALQIILGALVLIWRQPRLAAVLAVLGTVLLGVLLAVYALNGSAEFIYQAQGKVYGEHHSFFTPFAPGVFSGMYGPVILSGPQALWMTRLEGGLLILAGCALAPRLPDWAADAELARRASALTQRVDRLTRTRSDATSAAVAELRRIERDLHDGAQARLVAVGMSLRAAEELMRANPAAARALVAEARETSARALDDLRGLVRGIYPPVLADRGLGDAVRALALDTPLTVQTDVTLPGEPPMPVAAAVYFGIAETLTNAVRHGGADTVQITIGYTDVLRATVTDDGAGGADPSRGTGLAGVERRLATFDGILAVSSPPGGPTIVAIEVPCTLTDDAGRIARPSRQAGLTA